MGNAPRTVKGLILDRDGVLTRFDMGRLRAFFEPLIPVPLMDVAARWTRWCDRTTGPKDLTEEERFWSGFWDSLSTELGLSETTRLALRAFDYTQSVVAFPEARAALASARALGLKIGVLSNFPLASLERSLEAAGLADLVDVACSAPVIGAAKPSPAAYLGACERLEIDPDESVFFDDEQAAVAGARAVGMEAYWVNRAAAADDLEGHVIADLRGVAAVLGTRSQSVAPARR